jgi:hypothetical protein
MVWEEGGEGEGEGGRMDKFLLTLGYSVGREGEREEGCIVWEGRGRDGWNPNFLLLPSVVAATHRGDEGDKCTQNCHCSRGSTDHHLQHSLVTCTH